MVESIAPSQKPKHAARAADAFANRAYACGDRKLYATAAACLDSSSLDVEGSMSVFRLGTTGQDDVMIATDVIVHGTLVVPGLSLSGGSDMVLNYDNGSVGFLSGDGKTFMLSSFNAKALGPDKVAVSYSALNR